MTDILHKLMNELEELKLTQAKDRQKSAEQINGLKKDLEKQKVAHAEVHNAVILLQDEKVNLRKAVHKLKLRNGMLARKTNKLKERLRSTADDDSSDDDFDLIDYDDIGKSFIAIGGRNDPLAMGFSMKFKDSNGLEHKTGERYYWFLMAEYFKDSNAKNTIRVADTYQEADEARKSISGFDEKAWNNVKLEIYTKAQEAKFTQLKSLRNSLILTNPNYLAVSSDDKFFGTGWRKQREESMKPLNWDGENNGGKVLMKLRKQFKKNHSWTNDEEKIEAEQRLRELKKYVWRRQSNQFEKPRGTNYTPRGNGRSNVRTKDN